MKLIIINQKRLLNGLTFNNNKVNFRLIRFTKERYHNPNWLYKVTFDITIGEFKLAGKSHSYATNRENVYADEVIKHAIDYYTFLAKKIESERVR